MDTEQHGRPRSAQDCKVRIAETVRHGLAWETMRGLVFWEREQMRDKSEFKARREMVGMSQQALANALHVDKRSVQRWEAPNNDWMPPSDAWQIIDDASERQRWTVETALEIARDHDDAQAIDITYWKSQEDFERAGHEGDHQQANANARLIAFMLEYEGRAVSFGFGGLAQLGANVKDDQRF